MSEPQPSIAFFRSLRTIGPALIVASVVLGPGSILISSRVGCQYGYSMLWVLVLAAVLMIGMTALAARVGIAAENTLCGELATRIGRPFAVLIGVLFFLVYLRISSQQQHRGGHLDRVGIVAANHYAAYGCGNSDGGRGAESG